MTKLFLVAAVMSLAVLAPKAQGGLQSALEELWRRAPGARYNPSTGNVAMVNLFELTESEFEARRFGLRSFGLPLLTSNAIQAPGVTLAIDSPYEISWVIEKEFTGSRFDAGDIVSPETPVSSLRLARWGDERRSPRLIGPIITIPEPAAGLMVGTGVIAGLAVRQRRKSSP